MIKYSQINHISVLHTPYGGWYTVKQIKFAQSAETVEYNDSTSAKV